MSGLVCALVGRWLDKQYSTMFVLLSNVASPHGVSI